MSPETNAARAAVIEARSQTGTAEAAEMLLLARAVIALERIATAQERQAAALEHGRDTVEARDE